MPLALPPRPSKPEPTLSRIDAELAARALAEIARRRAESLYLYRPLPTVDAFHASEAKIRLIRGSNRAGKTMGACVEVARAATGQDPYNKWPKENGRFIIVAKDERELGQVIYRKLFRADGFHGFRIIRDPGGLWRAMEPFEDRTLTKPAPPLIPRRMVEHVAWSNKKAGVPKLVKLKNGWELIFAASGGEPIHGVDVDGVWFDEEIINGRWFTEMMARLVDRKGRFLWSATPQAGTEHLYAIHQRAEAREEGVEEFFISLAGNMYMDEREKRLLAANYSDEEYRVRILGEYAASGYLVYPEFTMDTHGVDMKDGVPPDWCRFMVVDPGRQVCAVLFAAVDPEEKHVVIYDELYIRKCSAGTFGDAVASKIGDLEFDAFIIDHHGGLITDIGSGKNVEAQYSEALAARKVSCRNTGSGFTWAMDDIKSNIEAVRGMLRIRADGTPRLQVVKNRCANLEWEMKYYHYKKGKDGVLTDDPVKKNDHLCQTLSYLAAYDPSYRAPIKRRRKPEVLRVLEERRKLRRKDKPHGYVKLG